MPDSPPTAESALETAKRPESVLSGSALQALEDFFSRAAVRGEKGLSVARIAISALALIRHGILHGAPNLSWEPRLTIVFLVPVGALIFSVWTLLRLEPGRLLSVHLRLSASFDAFIVGVLVLSRVYWAPETTTGLSHMPETYFLVLVMVASGLRLSRRAANLGVAACWLIFIGATWIDATINGISLLFAARSLAIVMLLLVGASVIGITTVRRTRRLVLEGASAAQRAERARQTLGVYLSEVVATEALDSADLCSPSPPSAPERTD